MLKKLEVEEFQRKKRLEEEEKSIKLKVMGNKILFFL